MNYNNNFNNYTNGSYNSPNDSGQNIIPGEYHQSYNGYDAVEIFWPKKSNTKQLIACTAEILIFIFIIIIGFLTVNGSISYNNISGIILLILIITEIVVIPITAGIVILYGIHMKKKRCCCRTTGTLIGYYTEEVKVYYKGLFWDNNKHWSHYRYKTVYYPKYLTVINGKREIRTVNMRIDPTIRKIENTSEMLVNPDNHEIMYVHPPKFYCSEIIIAIIAGLIVCLGCLYLMYPDFLHRIL